MYYYCLSWTNRKRRKKSHCQIGRKIANVLEISLSDLFSDQSVNSKKDDEFVENIIFEIKQLLEKEKKEILNIVKSIVKFKKG